MIEDWPDEVVCNDACCGGLRWTDYDRDVDGDDGIITWNHCRFMTWVVSEQSNPLTHTEFTITTNPADAPYDCHDEGWRASLFETIQVVPGVITYCPEATIPLTGYWFGGVATEATAPPTTTQPCTTCNGSGRVTGVFLPEAWPCDKCGGKGLV